jgi:septum formation protein
MPTQPTPLILASNSPRRRQLLTAAGYRFEVAPADDAVEAAVPVTPNPRDYPRVLAQAKARAVCSRFHSGVVLAADTIAICAGEILGKPRDRRDAQRMLQLLSGREHEVLTAVVLVDCGSGRELAHLECTRLLMDKLTDADLQHYLDTGLWQGKAGAFGYQDGWDWLHVVQGSESNVVGLPIERLPELFAHLEISPPAN